MADPAHIPHTGVRFNLLSAANESRTLRRMHGRMVRDAVGSFEEAFPIASAPFTAEAVRDVERALVRMTLVSFAKMMPGLSPDLALGFLVLPRAALRFVASRMGGPRG